MFKMAQQLVKLIVPKKQPMMTLILQNKTREWLNGFSISFTCYTPYFLRKGFDYQES